LDPEPLNVVCASPEMISRLVPECRELLALPIPASSGGLLTVREVQEGLWTAVHTASAGMTAGAVPT
jgi:hypothetical protein